MLGKLPEIWWEDWEKGHNWYDLEVRVGGEWQTRQWETFTMKSWKSESTTEMKLHSQAHRDSTNRLVALVDGLTTSEAADVMAQMNTAPSEINTAPSAGSSQERQVLAPRRILVLALLLGHRLPKVERRVSLLKGSRLVFLHLATFLRLESCQLLIEALG
jgi:hypothetical protein